MLHSWTIEFWEGYNVQCAINLEHLIFVLWTLATQTTSKQKLLERENKVIRCFELAGDLTLLYLQVGHTDFKDLDCDIIKGGRPKLQARSHPVNSFNAKRGNNQRHLILTCPTRCLCFPSHSHLLQFSYCWLLQLLLNRSLAQSLKQLFSR